MLSWRSGIGSENRIMRETGGGEEEEEEGEGEGLANGMDEGERESEGGGILTVQWRSLDGRR